jgi:hypothetical protein
MLVLAAIAGLASPITPVRARGGGPANIMNSEGYQRALREERKQYQPPQPVAPVATPPRHHHHRNHR